MIFLFILSYSILFDFTKNEDAANSDWIIDRDMPYPSPSNPVKEDDWDGAISAWGVHFKKEGWKVMTLPYYYSITYGTNMTTDLKNFDIFVIPEPQNPLTYNEKKAIYDFVRDGGSLIIIANHAYSDRNNNGYDSPMVFNEMGIKDSFGLYFESRKEAYSNITKNSSYIADYNHPVVVNKGGRVNSIAFHGGTTIKYYSYLNSEAKPVILYKSGYAMVAVSKFGKGKIVAIGDSSPVDDGTGDTHDKLYNGWAEEDDSILFINATYYCVEKEGVKKNNERKKDIYPGDGWDVYDIRGTYFGKMKSDRIDFIYRMHNSGIYILRNKNYVKKIVVLH